MRCVEPGVARVQAASLSPEISIVVVHQDNLSRSTGGKADGVLWPEGSSPEREMASGQDTTGV